MTSTRWMVVCALALVGCGETSDDGDSPDDTPNSTDPADPTIAGPGSSVGGEGERVEVVEVFDGDTLVVLGSGGEDRVRVIGVNTPQRDECFYDEARESMRALAAGGSVRLVRDVSDRDQFGRLVRYLETEDGIDAGAELVRGGFARSIRFEPDVSRNDLYDDLQVEAQADQRGRQPRRLRVIPPMTGRHYAGGLVSSSIQLR